MARERRGKEAKESNVRDFGQGTGSWPPRAKGLHRKMRQMASHPPLKMPCFWIAS
jgi:hypothetical protein